MEERLEQIPVLYCRGTHRTIGFIIGRQFKGIIANLLEKWDLLTKILLPEYETGRGREIYNKSLDLCTRRFPKYVQELEGMAEGCGQPFYKLFLLHMESTIVSADTQVAHRNATLDTGCTSLLCNSEEVLLGHTEDADLEFLNNVYIVAAEVLGDDGEIVENFMTLTYAGHLPGYTMGWNSAGLVYTINTLYPTETFNSGTPRAFLARAILRACNMEEALEILRDEGYGTSDGLSVNLAFVNNTTTPLFINVEVSPRRNQLKAKDPSTNQSDGSESELSVLTINQGEFYAHCNKYLRLQPPEYGRQSSVHRHKSIERYSSFTSLEAIKEILSDTSDEEYPIFRRGRNPDAVVTAVVGIFDLKRRTWSIYTSPPATSSPIVVLPMTFGP